jgi:hypothetical protein
MKKLLIELDKTNFEELTSWFVNIGYPCLQIGISDCYGLHWSVNIIYQHFEVEISDEKLYTMACLRWL